MQRIAELVTEYMRREELREEMEMETEIEIEMVRETE